jgi:hypothetical protein
MNKIKNAGKKVEEAWLWLDKKVSKLSNILNNKVEVLNSKVRRKKKPIIIATVILLVFMLTSALVLASFRSVSYQNTGVVINYTE